MLYVFAISLVLIAVGELADKSQLLALLFATRYKAWQVLLGIFLSSIVAFSLATAFGMLVGEFIPSGVLPWVSGLLFVGFGIWTLRGENESDPEHEVERGTRFGPVMTVAAAFFVAEFGDKTQIMTIAIAADPGGALLEMLQGSAAAVSDTLSRIGLVPAEEISSVARFVGVTLGATVGMVIADGIAIAAGRLLGHRLPERLLSRISGIAFIAFGVLTILAPYLSR